MGWGTRRSVGGRDQALRLEPIAQALEVALDVPAHDRGEHPRAAAPDVIADVRAAVRGGLEAVGDVHRERRLHRVHVERCRVERDDLVDVLDAAAEEVGDAPDAASYRAMCARAVMSTLMSPAGYAGTAVVTRGGGRPRRCARPRGRSRARTGTGRARRRRA